MLSTPCQHTSSVPTSDRMEPIPGSRRHDQPKAAKPFEHSGQGDTAWGGTWLEGRTFYLLAFPG